MRHAGWVAPAVIPAGTMSRQQEYIMSQHRLWILGASDPEMAAIERLLLDAGERIAYASIGVDRVHLGNAYRATSPRVAEGQVYLVECDVLGGFPGAVRADHHRPGDPGYGRPSAAFLPASSIGQVYLLLAEQDGRSDESGYWAMSGSTSGWCLSREAEDGSREYDDVPLSVVLCAAADHCLEAAYRGRCPGVDPDALMKWRAESRAAFQGRPVEAVLADVEAARKRLRDVVLPPPAWAIDPDPSSDWPGCEHSAPEYADLRGQSIPELPEAAAREGIPFLATVTDRDGRVKTVLQAAPPDLVRQFLAGEIVPGLKGMYGDPARGFAGGYR